MKDWSNLARIVFRRTYSRSDDGTPETWEQTGLRAIMGNVKGHNVPEAEIKTLLRLHNQRKAIAAGRGLWFSGTQAHAKIGGVALNNCLAYETEVITDRGIFPIGSLQGQIVTVLTDNGKWVQAPVREYGVQSLCAVELYRGKARKTVYATHMHDWVVVEKDSRKKVKTIALRPKDVLAANFLKTNYDKELKNWRVGSVTPTKRRETVYCASVPETHTFTLADNILTGNCWFVTADDWQNFVIMADLLMLGGGVGASVEHRYVSKLPRIKRDVQVIHKGTKDADFIIPDSREGWCEAMRRAYEAFFVTGKSFTYSTICLRGKGEPIKSFGGLSSGPLPLIKFFDNLNLILGSRGGKHVRPIDAADIVTATGEVVVSGNVRRSAIIILGDPWDKEFLTAKRWDLGTLPSYRSCANYSIVISDPDDFHPLFWKTFEVGEAFGVYNRKAVQKYGRMGEEKEDTAVGVNPCGEATLEPFEPCNLQEIALPNLKDEDEFILAARMMHRYGKRVTMERYHHEQIQRVVNRNRRVGTSITGCLSSSLFTAPILDRVYRAIQEENVSYSKLLGIPESIRTTVIKPSGTVSKVLDMDGFEGIHPAYSRYFVQRIRFAGNDPLIPLLRSAGHHMEPVKLLDGGFDHNTLVVDFYASAPENAVVADENFSTWEHLKAVQMAQKHWSDQSVSVSAYYKKSEIPEIKEWLTNNLKTIKTISFLAHSEHGFLQAPKEAISREQFEQLSAKIKPIEFEQIGQGSEIADIECQGGVCPVK